MIVEKADDGPQPAGRGRPPVLLRLDAAAGSALGIDFGHRHVRVAVADLASTVLAERFLELDVDDAPEESLDAAAELVTDVLVDAGVDRSRVIGAGMALAAPIDRHKGVLGSTVLPGWAGIQAGEELSRRLEIPVELDNDANLGALAEVSFGAGRGLADVVYVMMSAGIGAGLVLGGRLYHGATGIAGRARAHPDAAGRRRLPLRKPRLPGDRGRHRRGPLTPPPHARRRSDAARRCWSSSPTATSPPGASSTTPDGRSGGPLADLCNYLNPAAIVVGGDLSAAGEPSSRESARRSTATHCRAPRRRWRSRLQSSASARRSSARSRSS